MDNKHCSSILKLPDSNLMAQHLKNFFTNPKSLAVAKAFFLLGFMFGNWASLIPYIKDRHGLGDDELGLVLLCLPLGALSFNPISTILIDRYGLNMFTNGSMIALATAYSLPILSPSILLLSISLVIVGCTMTALNIGANIMATKIQEQESILILSSCHGMFSIGLMIGSLMRSMTLGLQLTEQWHIISMTIFGLFIAYSSSLILNTIPTKNIYTYKDSKAKFVFPKGNLLIMVLISVCINMTEGSMSDWAALFMQDVVQSSPYYVAWGLTSYSAMMALGRFFGDGIIPLIGRNRVLFIGALTSIVGLMIVIFLPYTFTAIVGFGLVGLGVSCGAPILYASATNFPDIPNGGGLAIMNTFAMGGFLFGPVIIGFISQASSLRVGFGLVAVLSLFWLWQGRKVILFG